jgi:hypothetical protein
VHVNATQVTTGMKCIQHAATTGYPDRNPNEATVGLIRHCAVRSQNKEASFDEKASLVASLEVYESYYQVETRYKKLENSLERDYPNFGKNVVVRVR